MANYDPALRRETWVFQRLTIRSHKNHGPRCFRRAGYKWVHYDGSPDRLLEPVNAVPGFYGLLNGWSKPVNPEVDGTAIIGFEFTDTRYFNDGVHRFDTLEG